MDGILRRRHGLSHFRHLDQLSTRKSLCGNGHANIVREYSAPYIYQESVISPFATHRKYCCTPRTPGCKKYEKETLKRPPSSNFITHSMICKAVPAAESWAAFQAARNGTGRPEMSGTGDSAAKVVGIEGQRTFMDHFTARGLQNPERTVTSKGFRERLVKGIIEDDLPYSLGEKSGMSKLFDYLLPRGISTPSHQTVRRDLDILYDKLDTELNRRLMVRTVFVLYYT